MSFTTLAYGIISVMALIHSIRHRFQSTPIAWMLLFAVVGTVAIVALRAASAPLLGIEAESGVIGGSATVINDSTASGGRAVSFGSGSGGGSGSGSGKFYIVGKDIIGPDGKTFIPFGGNVAMSIVRSSGQLDRPYAFDFGGTANGHSDQALAWGWNIIRVDIVCYRSDGYASPRELANSVDTLAAEYTAKKIVVMPECHDDTGQTLAYNGSSAATAMAKAEEFWGYVMADNKNNPYVWLNFFNESTSGVDSSSLSYWQGLMNYYINKRNALGAENIAVLDLPNYGQGAEPFATTSIGSDFLATKCNALLSWHAYGGAAGQVYSSYDSWFSGIRSRNLPLMFGEYGFRLDEQSFVPGNQYLPSHTELVATTDKVLAWYTGSGVGSAVWGGDGDSANDIVFSLMGTKSNPPTAATAAFHNGANGSGLSPLGQKVWNAGHNPPARTAFSGNYADSHCSSAGK